MRTVNGGADVFLGQHGGFAALVGLAACTQTATAELNDLVCAAACEGLCIGIGANELYSAHGGVDHVLHRVAAAAAHANHLDLGTLVESFFFK